MVTVVPLDVIVLPLKLISPVELPPPLPIPKFAGVIFFKTPPSFIKTWSASLLEVVVVPASALPVVSIVPLASGKVTVLAELIVVGVCKIYSYVLVWFSHSMY